MHIRILIITLVLLVTAFAVPAQDEATVDDESADSEQPSEQAATTGTGEIEAQEPAAPAARIRFPWAGACSRCGTMTKSSTGAAKR